MVLDWCSFAAQSTAGEYHVGLLLHGIGAAAICKQEVAGPNPAAPIESLFGTAALGLGVGTLAALGIRQVRRRVANTQGATALTSGSEPNIAARGAGYIAGGPTPSSLAAFRSAPDEHCSCRRPPGNGVVPWKGLGLRVRLFTRSARFHLLP